MLKQISADTLISFGPMQPGPTAGFLRSAVNSGRLPELPVLSPSLRLVASARIALHQTGDPSRHECPSTGNLSAMSFERGSRIVFSDFLVVVAKQGTIRSRAIYFDSRFGNTIELRAGPLNLQLASQGGGAPKVCQIEAASPGR